MGHIGTRLADLFIRLGEDIAIVALEIKHEDRLRELGDHARFVKGDASDERCLVEAGIGNARAVVAVTDDDMINVSIALLVKRINPRAAVVVRLFDQLLASHLESTLGIQRVLSTSAIAAPSFVAPVINDMIKSTFEAGGVSWNIEEVEIPGAGDLQDAAEQVRARGMAAIAGSGDDPPSLPSEPLRIIALRPLSARKKPGKQGGGWGLKARTFLAGIASWWNDSPRVVRLALAWFSAVIVAAVALFHVQMNIPVVDSFYFVVTIITTVGFGDYNLMNSPGYLKIFGAFLMVCGAAILAVLFSIITDVMISTRFRDVLARGASKYRGHIIVAGLGNIGYRVVRELVHRGETVVAIEQDEGCDYIAPTKDLCPVIIGSAKAEQTFLRAGLPGAKAVIAVTDDDITNLGAGLAAKRASASCRVVVRIFDSLLARRMHEGFGFDAVLSVSHAAAATFAGAVFFPDVVHGLVIGSSLFMIFYRKETGPARDARTNPDSTMETILFARKKGETCFSPCVPGIPCEPGDEIIGVRRRVLTNEALT
mgnify:CR=1 FL=1